MNDREKLIELLGSAESAFYWNSDDKSFVEKIADHLIANGVAVAKNETTTPRWISVEDEKPKRRGHYFISYVFRCSDIRFYGEAMWHDDMEGNGYVTGQHFSNEGMDGMRVTHWMEIPRIPLSKPPEEEW